jgi:hypothetical protein
VVPDYFWRFGDYVRQGSHEFLEMRTFQVPIAVALRGPPLRTHDHARIVQGAMQAERNAAWLGARWCGNQPATLVQALSLYPALLSLM